MPSCCDGTVYLFGKPFMVRLENGEKETVTNVLNVIMAHYVGDCSGYGR